MDLIVEVHQTIQGFEERCLAATRWANDCGDLSVRNIHSDVRELRGFHKRWSGVTKLIWGIERYLTICLEYRRHSSLGANADNKNDDQQDKWRHKPCVEPQG